jgi:hypothetical protein
MSVGTLILAGLLCAAGAAPAADVYHMKERNIMIPIRLDPSRRVDVKQLLLFSSTDEGKNWQQENSVEPDKDAFTFYAPGEGSYWFSVAVVDKQGHREPAENAKLAANMKIVIDTVKPVVRIVSAERQGNDVVVRWDVQEAHPDVNTVKLEYRLSDMPADQWYTAVVNQPASGQASFHVNSLGPVSVRIQVQDLAQNTGSATAEVAAAAPAAGSNAFAGSGLGTAAQPAIPLPSATATNWETSHVPVMPVSRTEIKPDPVFPPVTNYPQPPPSNPAAGPGGHWLASTENVGSPPPPAAAVTDPRQPQASLPPVQIVNSRQVPLAYEVVKQGPSGIGKATLWMTRDDGRNWERFADYTDVQTPIVVDLSDRAEGVYGFTLVVQSRAGLGRRPPIAGESPEIRVELDLTAPVARLAAPEQDPHKPNALVLGWSVTDLHLDPTPISLYYSEKPGGPWQPIAKDLRNTGRYTWDLPPNPPYRVYLRLTARDTAGNTSEVATPDPVLVDLSEPEVKLRGVATSYPRPQ